MNTHAEGPVFNIGSTETSTIVELAEVVNFLTDSRSEICFYHAYGEV